MNTPFNITREDVLNLAAQKLLDEFYQKSSVASVVTERIKECVKGEIAVQMQQKIAEQLTTAIETMMNSEVVPVDIWGGATGTPTTIRAAIVEQARRFWADKVDADGKPSANYSAVPRSQHMYQKIVGKVFEDAIRQDSINIVGAFKDALIKDISAQAAEHIGQLIRVRTKANS